jgi:hypothetical protein
VLSLLLYGSECWVVNAENMAWRPPSVGNTVTVFGAFAPLHAGRPALPKGRLQGPPRQAKRIAQRFTLVPPSWGVPAWRGWECRRGGVGRIAGAYGVSHTAARLLSGAAGAVKGDHDRQPPGSSRMSLRSDRPILSCGGR